MMHKVKVRLARVAGDLLFSLDYYQKAERYYTRVLELEPNDADTWCIKSVTLGRLNRHNEAKEDFVQALEVNPDLDLAEFWFYQDKYLVELTCHSELLRKFRFSYASVLHHYGNFLAERNRYKEALACFDYALELDPNSITTWENKAEILDKLSNEAWNKVLEIKKRAEEAWDKALREHFGKD